MTTPRWILFKNSPQWRVLRSTGLHSQLVDIPNPPLNPTPIAWAEALAAAVHADGYDGGGVLVAIDSVDCLAVTFNIDDPEVRRDRQALVYELESFLPLPAEQFTADFVRQDGCVFAVAIENAPFRLFLETLESNGVSVQSCVPLALSVAQCLSKQRPQNGQNSREQRRAILWENSDRVECVLENEHGPLAWRLMEKDAKIVPRALDVRSDIAGCPTRVLTCGGMLSSKSLLSLRPEMEIEHLVNSHEGELLPEGDSPPESVLGQAADDVLSGRTRPWIEFRRDILAATDPYRSIRRPLRFALLGAAALMVALGVAFLVRSHQYAKLADLYHAQQAVAFHDVLPKQTVSTGFHHRLESEYRRLAGLKGDTSELPRRVSALNSLHRLLESLPKDLRFRLLEVRLEQDQIHVDGQVRSHGDADTIASALRKGGFVVESPATQKLPEQGVSVRMIAQWRNKP